MAGATQFIGCKISLISKSEIRYEGILYSLDVVEATISLAKVKSFGTEDRRTERMVPPKDEIYEFIIFRGSDIKGIDVVEPPKPTVPIVNDGLPNDPAIVEVSSHYHTPSSSRSQSSGNIGPVPVQVPVPSPQGAASNASYGSSPFSGNTAASTSTPSVIPPKPLMSTPTSHPIPPANRTMGAVSSAFVPNSPEPAPLRFESREEPKVKEASDSQSSTPALMKTPNMREEESHHLRQPYGRGGGGGNRGGRGQGYHRGGGDDRPRDRGGRGGNRGRGDGMGFGGRGQGQGPRRHGSQDYTEGLEGSYGNGGRGRSHGSSDFHHQTTEGSQGYQSRGGRGGYQGGGGSGYRGNRGGGGGGYYRNNRTQGILRAPQTAKVTFDNDFDFEKANEELQTAIKNLKMTEKANEAEKNGGDHTVVGGRSDGGEQENKEPPPVCYKKDDFFDSISCEALERGKGTNNRPDWKAERKLNAETFGLSGRGGGGGRGYYHHRGGGGRGYYNNQGSSGGGRGYYHNQGGYSNSGYRGGGGGYSGYNNRYNGGRGRGRGGGASETADPARTF